MLGKFGENLKAAMNRISGAAIVDKKVLDATIKDIQRALISSDVDIQLVFELCERIKQRTKAEKAPKNLTKKQFILKIVYEELTNLLGTGKKPALEKKKILLVGLFGSGKCVHGSSLIPLADGELNKIEDIYNNFSTKKTEKKVGGAKNGFRIDLDESDLLVHSLDLDTLKMATTQNVGELLSQIPVFAHNLEKSIGLDCYLFS